MIYLKNKYSQFALKPDIYLGAARTIKIPSEEKADFTFFHPPYFALYKYSSDVLRFELEWGGYNRKDILRRELRDGFKTSDCDKIYPYIDDLKAAIINGFNNTKENHNVGIVVGNSTLAEKDLPIIENLLNNCENDGICCTQIIRRPINHSQATYHKSANPNIKSNTDFILIFARV